MTKNNNNFYKLWNASLRDSRSKRQNSTKTSLIFHLLLQKRLQLKGGVHVVFCNLCWRWSGWIFASRDLTIANRSFGIHLHIWQLKHTNWMICSRKKVHTKNGVKSMYILEKPFNFAEIRRFVNIILFFFSWDWFIFHYF